MTNSRNALTSTFLLINFSYTFVWNAANLAVMACRLIYAKYFLGSSVEIAAEECKFQLLLEKKSAKVPVKHELGSK